MINYISYTLENADKAIELIKENPFINDLLKDWLEWEDDYFRYTREHGGDIGTSDRFSCLNDYLKDNGSSVDEIRPLFDKKDLSVMWLFNNYEMTKPLLDL